MTIFNAASGLVADLLDRLAEKVARTDKAFGYTTTTVSEHLRDPDGGRAVIAKMARAEVKNLLAEWAEQAEVPFDDPVSCLRNVWNLYQYGKSPAAQAHDDASGLTAKTTTVFSLEPVGSRTVIKEWIYPTEQIDPPRVPPADVRNWIRANHPDHPDDGTQFLERVYDAEGRRISTAGSVYLPVEQREDLAR